MTSFYNLESFDEQEKNYEISLFNNQKNYTEKIDESVNESFPMMKSHREDDESFFEKNPQPDLYLNIKPKLPMDILLGENTDKKTKPNTITKTKKEKTEENEINFEQNDIEPKSFCQT